MPKEEKEKAKKLVIVEEMPSDEETPVAEVEEKKETETPDTEETKIVDTSDDTREEKKEEKSEDKVVEEKIETEKPNYLWIVIPTALLVGALVGGLITYFSGVSKLDKDKVTPTPIATEIPIDKETPVPSSVGELKRDTLKIQVLNGSGTSGAAGKAKTYLEELGYQDVDTGNASSSDFSEMEISIKDSSKDYLDLITSDLSKSYKVASDSKTLVTTSKYDVVITLGSK